MDKLLHNIISIFIHPYITKEKVRWLIKKRKLADCGRHTTMAESFVLRGAENIHMGKDTHCSSFCQLCTYEYYKGRATGYKPGLYIGDNVTITSHCFISCVNKVVIGDGCLLGVNVLVTDNLHGSSSHEELSIPPDDRALFSKGPVIIGKNVWIGRNVCIMPGVTIGDGAVIGANSVVTHDIPDNCVAAGVPARVVRRIDISE